MANLFVLADKWSDGAVAPSNMPMIHSPRKTGKYSLIQYREIAHRPSKDGPLVPQDIELCRSQSGLLFASQLGDLRADAADNSMSAFQRK